MRSESSCARKSKTCIQTSRRCVALFVGSHTLTFSLQAQGSLDVCNQEIARLTAEVQTLQEQEATLNTTIEEINKEQAVREEELEQVSNFVTQVCPSSHSMHRRERFRRGARTTLTPRRSW